MRKITTISFGIVLLVFHVLLSVGQAQKINVLIVGDTGDRKIGKSVETDVRNLLGTFWDHVPERQLNMQILAGKNVSTQNILKTIKSFKPRSSDAVVFLWSGHGAYNRNGHYFNMPNGEFLYRSTVVNAVRKQGAGMDAVISDCCNVFVPLRLPPTAGERPRPSRISPIFKSLFLDTKGLVDINGASEGELGMGTPADGGIFMKSFCEYLHINQDKTISWHTLIAQIRPEMQIAFQRATRGKKPTYKGTRQTTQSVRVWHLPPGWPKSDSHSNTHVASIEIPTAGPLGRYHPEVGDVIVEVNGERIHTRQDCIDAVNRSPEIMEFVALDKRTGRPFTYRTRLRSHGSRFGIGLADTGGNGARITKLYRGYPCNQCEVVLGLRER